MLWLQAGDAFADLRIPDRSATDAPTRSRASRPTRSPRSRGTTRSTGTAASPVTTAASSNGDDDELIERGEFERDGTCHTYEEIWQRVDPGSVGIVLTAAHAMVVRVGGHCLAMRDRRRAGGEFDVRHAQVAGIEWTDVTVLGDGAELPRPPVVLPDDWDVGSEVVVDGAPWRVAERWG